MHISALCIYPVKSLGAVSLREARVQPRGLEGDRRWMIVDTAGRFITRREAPVLAGIAISLMPDGGYRLRSDKGEAHLPQSFTKGKLQPVTVWGDTIPAWMVENDASRLISAVAGRDLRLAYMPDDVHRAVSPAYARSGDQVSFADGFPVLVASEASLAALNATLALPVEMARFRANIMLAGDELEPWAEAGWSGLDCGEVRLRLPKPCVRCIVITQQPETGERHEGNAVPMALRRLGQIRPEGVLFGMNAIAASPCGRIALGSHVVPCV